MFEFQAWKMWNEGNGLSFVEQSIVSRETEEEIVRCIQIGLLCVQEHPMDRPSIETVLLMLSRDIVEPGTELENYSRGGKNINIQIFL